MTFFILFDFILTIIHVFVVHAFIAKDINSFFIVHIKIVFLDTTFYVPTIKVRMKDVNINIVHNIIMYIIMFTFFSFRVLL